MRDIVQRTLIVPVFLGLVGCAGTPGIAPDDRAGVGALFRVATVDAQGPRSTGGEPVSARGARVFSIETRLVGAAGEVLQAPHITVHARQRANVSVIDQTAYIETFDVEQQGYDVIADPVVGMLHNGIVLEVCAAPEGDDALLAYRALVSDVLRPIPTREVHISGPATGTIQLPKVASSEATGVRRVVPGVWTRLATLAAGERAVDVHVRVVAVDLVAADPEDASDAFIGPDAAGPIDFTADGGDAFPLRDWLGDRGADLRIDVDALVLPGAAPVGEVFDAGVGARHGLDRARVLGSTSITSRPVPGAVARISLDEAYVADYEERGGLPVIVPRVDTLRSGLLAAIDPDGRLALTWATAPRWSVFSTTLRYGPPVVIDLPEVRIHGRTVDLQPGARLVTLGRTADGGTMALRVSVAGVSGQRRVASQTQATRNRTPSGVSAR